MNEYIEKTISFDSYFFPIFQKAIKSVEYPEKELKISVLNRKKSEIANREIKDIYLFKFDWQDKYICSISVFGEI